MDRFAKLVSGQNYVRKLFSQYQLSTISTIWNNYRVFFFNAGLILLQKYLLYVKKYGDQQAMGVRNFDITF